MHVEQSNRISDHGMPGLVHETEMWEVTLRVGRIVRMVTFARSVAFIEADPLAGGLVGWAVLFGPHMATAPTLEGLTPHLAAWVGKGIARGIIAALPDGLAEAGRRWTT